MQRTGTRASVGQGQHAAAGSNTGSKTFRALRFPNFRLFFYGQLVSLIGTWMQSVAQQWLVYRITDSASKLGIVAAASSLPVLFLSLWAGVFIDRLPKRSVLVATQTVSMLLAFTLAGLVYFDVVQFWHVVVLATLLGCVNAIDMPARQAFVPEMIDDKADLGNAIALNSSIFNGARVVGPAIAGVLVAAVGEAMAFSINGISYLAVIAGLLMMRLPRFEPTATNRTPLLDLIEGLRYVLRDPVKRVLIGALMVHSIFGTLHITLMPVFARDVFTVTGVAALENGELRLGVLMATFGLGALIASLSLATLDDRVRRGLRISTGLFIYPLAFILFSLAPNFWVALPLLLIGGWAMITLLASSNTLLQTTTPDHLRGRVMSLYSLTLVGLMPFGSLLAGFLTDQLGSASLAVRSTQSIVLLTAFVVFFLAPQLRRAE